METYFDNIERTLHDPSRDRVINDLKTLARDAEEFMKATAGDVGEKALEARSRLAAALENAKATCAGLEQRAVATAKAADKVIRAHPYHSIGLAFGIGVLLGVLVNRK